MIELRTIPHTGTNYATRLLANHMHVKLRVGHIEEVRTYHRTDTLRAATVTTVRDPRSVAISLIGRAKRLMPELWTVLARWLEQPHVHFLNVPASPADIAELAAFVGSDTPVAFPERADNTIGDPLGLKALYARGGTDERVENYVQAVPEVFRCGS